MNVCHNLDRTIRKLDWKFYICSPFWIWLLLTAHQTLYSTMPGWNKNVTTWTTVTVWLEKFSLLVVTYWLTDSHTQILEILSHLKKETTFWEVCKTLEIPNSNPCWLISCSSKFLFPSLTSEFPVFRTGIGQLISILISNWLILNTENSANQGLNLDKGRIMINIICNHKYGSTQRE